MVDLTTQTPLAAGSAVLEYAGYPIFPPNPTMALSAKRAQPGAVLTVTDAPGATTYWWLATLAVLQGLLGGGAPPPVTFVVDFVGKHHTYVPATNTVTVAPSTYNGKTFTVPVLSGTITVPPGVSGNQKVYVQLLTTLLGSSSGISAGSKLKVVG